MKQDDPKAEQSVLQDLRYISLDQFKQAQALQQRNTKLPNSSSKFESTVNEIESNTNHSSQNNVEYQMQKNNLDQHKQLSLMI